jgi:hypothetical protein
MKNKNRHKPFCETLGTDGDTEARMRCDGTNLWFEIRKVGSDRWEKIARRVDRQWESVQPGATVTFRDESFLLPKDDDEYNPN